MPVYKKLGALLSMCAVATLSACGGGGDSGGSGSNAPLTPSQNATTIPADGTVRIDGGSATPDIYTIAEITKTSGTADNGLPVTIATAVSSKNDPKVTLKLLTDKTNKNKYLVQVYAATLPGDTLLKVAPYACKSGTWGINDLTSVPLCPDSVVVDTATGRLTMNSSSIPSTTPSTGYSLVMSFNAVLQ